MKQSQCVRRVLWVGLGLTFFASGQAWAQDEPDVGKLLEFVRWGGVLASVPIILAGVFLLSVVEKIVGRLAARFSHQRLLIQKVQTAVRFFVYTAMVGIAISLSIRLDDTAMAVIGGALAFAVGFAMRDLVASFIAGITIIFDRPFQVGDRVAYAGEYGDITKIGLRSVRMLTLDHNLITIPNNKVFTDITSSGNYGVPEMQVPMDFLVGIDQNITLAQSIVREACLASPYVFLEQPVPILVKPLVVGDYLAFQVKARPYVFDCRFEKPFETDVHLRVLEAFTEAGIHPPAVLHRSVNQVGDKHILLPLRNDLAGTHIGSGKE